MQPTDALFQLNPTVCDRARRARDARFDGLFFIAVTSTGIYCRPVCPAPAPQQKHVRYFTTAAAAAAAGYRPCLRCRPEAAPGSPLHRGAHDLVIGALRLIEEGVLDRESVSGLSRRVGIGERHLRRLFTEQLGTSPVEVNATRRVLFAKKLLSETNLPITAIAMAAGYGSVRRFNTTFRDTYGIAPRQLRRKRLPVQQDDWLDLRLPYRAPYDFEAQLAFFERRAIPGIESVDKQAYRRVFVIDDQRCRLRVTQRHNDNALSLQVQVSDPTLLPKITARVRRMFDLDADPRVINNELRRDSVLRASVKKHPGQRLPGGWDGFEIAVRAVLGQQVSVAAARTLLARLVNHFGSDLCDESNEDFANVFPDPARIATAELEKIGIPRARADTLRALAQALCARQLNFNPAQALDVFVAACLQIRGIGEWTAHYIAMRALSHPDAFPAADLVLRKAVSTPGKLISVKELKQMSADWSPWRSYAVMHLWRSQN